MNTSTIVQKLWNYCNGPGLGQSLARSPGRKHAGARFAPRLALRDDGMSYGDYVEQLTYLLFLKMADERDDFWATTSNKQLNFVQHVESLLKINGLAAVVVPDNVLFEGGAGETIRRKLLQECDVHTLLRPPAGLFYEFVACYFGLNRAAVGVPSGAMVEGIAAKAAHTGGSRHDRTPTWLEEKAPHPGPLPASGAREMSANGRWRAFDYEEIIRRDKASLDIFWLRDESLEDSENLPEPDVIAREIVEDLQAALEQFRLIAGDLGVGNGDEVVP